MATKKTVSATTSKSASKKTKATETPKKVKAIKKGSIGDLITNAAQSKYPYLAKSGLFYIDNKTWKKLPQEEYSPLLKHKEICVELVRLAERWRYNKDSEPFPYSLLTYFAIDTSAQKPSSFAKGYSAINIKKAETILRWLKWFATYNKNPKFYTSDKIAHAFDKLYKEYSKEDKDFKALMAQWEKMSQKDGFKQSAFKNMKAFYELFTKPLIMTAVVDETTCEETIVNIEPNPLVVEEPSTESVATSCTALILRPFYPLVKMVGE